MGAPDYQTTRIWKRTLTKLRLIAAMTGERIVQVLDRLADAELARLQQGEQRGDSDGTKDL
jgi:hypothetical protein